MTHQYQQNIEQYKEINNRLGDYQTVDKVGALAPTQTVDKVGALAPTFF